MAHQGDDNRNASVAVAWRRTGETAWRDGLPLLRLQGEAVQQGASFHYVAPNMFAGSVFDLDPNTSYDIRLRLTDPDAPAGTPPVERMVTARTRPVPKPATGGAVYHVYPRDYTGAKLEPNFNSLMAAYNTGANGADFVNSFQPRVKPGDIILVHAGTYREDRRRYAGPNSTLFDGTFYLTADGTADKPIVIKSAGDGEVDLRWRRQRGVVRSDRGRLPLRRRDHGPQYRCRVSSRAQTHRRRRRIHAEEFPDRKRRTRRLHRLGRRA